MTGIKEKMKMKIFTIKNGNVTEGVRVDSYTLKGAGITIPAIIVGEEGRGRKLGVLPVKLHLNSYEEWRDEGYVYINFAEIGETKAGKPKLYQTEDADTLEKCICVFRTKIGYRGGNDHSGDLKEEYWVPYWTWRSDLATLGKEKVKFSKEEAIEIGEKLNIPWDRIFEKETLFFPFPGEILCRGVIAQGDAGRMGSGEQLVAIIPADTVFRTGYSGRLYGAPSEHYYIFRGGRILAATWEEREVSDIF